MFGSVFWFSHLKTAVFQFWGLPGFADNYEVYEEKNWYKISTIIIVSLGPLFPMVCQHNKPTWDV